MSDSLLLNWAAMAVSLFNAILLLWLGLTVLLNSDRRAWGIWLAAAGLLMGGMFFVSHSAILSLSPVTLSLGMVFWWTVGLVPAVLMPFGWYVVTLWYSGFWQEKVGLFQRRHGFWFALVTLIMQMGIIAIAIGIPDQMKGNTFGTSDFATTRAAKTGGKAVGENRKQTVLRLFL